MIASIALNALKSHLGQLHLHRWPEQPSMFEGGKALKPLFIGQPATIFEGECKGITGQLVMADSRKKKVAIEVDRGRTKITTDWDKVRQGPKP